MVDIYSMDGEYINLDKRLRGINIQKNQKMSVEEAVSIVLEHLKKYADQHGGIKFRYINNNNRGSTNRGFGIESGDGHLKIIYTPNDGLYIKIGTKEFKAGNEPYIDIGLLFEGLIFIINNLYKEKKGDYRLGH